MPSLVKYHGPQIISGASRQNQCCSFLLSNWGRWGLKTQKTKHKMAPYSPDILSWFEKKTLFTRLQYDRAAAVEIMAWQRGSKYCLVKSIRHLDPSRDLDYLCVFFKLYFYISWFRECCIAVLFRHSRNVLWSSKLLLTFLRHGWEKVIA